MIRRHSPLRALVVIDGRNPLGSSTTELLLEGMDLGVTAWLLHHESLEWRSDRGMFGPCRSVSRGDGPRDIALGARRRLKLSGFDVLLMRLCPPVDPLFIATCQELADLETQLLCVNRPSAILAWPEKLVPLRYPGIHPDTLVSQDQSVLQKFAGSHGAVVVKPLYDYQGHGVQIYGDGMVAWQDVVDLISRTGAPVIIQQYLPSVRQGDMRVFLVDGRPAGAFLRIPQQGSDMASLHAGAVPRAATLGPAELDICDRIGSDLAHAGLPFVGLDVIGGQLTEIGTTSPTGLVQLRELNGARPAKELWRWIIGTVS